MLIAIEGIDGAGKTSVANTLSTRLPDAKVGYGGLPDGKDMSKRFKWTLDRFKSGRESSADPVVRCLPFMLARMMHRPELLRAAGSAETHLVLDRYVMTNVAYAYCAAYLSTALVDKEDAPVVAELIAGLEFDVLSLPVPDATFVLRVLPVVASRRIASDTARVYDQSPEAKYESAIERLAVLDYTFSTALRPLFGSRGPVFDVDTCVDGIDLSVGQVTEQIYSILERESLI